MLWEIGLHIAGNPNTPYYGPRDMCIAVGSGSNETFKPWLRMSTGSPILAHAVCRNELEAAMINPSGLLTQAYRGTGIFSEKLPVRIVAVYPSLDHFVYLIHPRTGLKSLAEIKEKKYPLRLSIREDATHSTRVLVDQTLAAYGMTVKDIESWGGSLQLNGGPGDERRMKAIREGTIDAIFDEGLLLWFERSARLRDEAGHARRSSLFKYLVDDLGWRKYTIKPGRFKGLKMKTTLVSTTAAGRSTPARPYPTTTPIKSATPSPRAKTRCFGKIPTPASASSAKTPTPRRATFRSIQARRNGTASTGLRCRNSQFVRTNR